MFHNLTEYQKGWVVGIIEGEGCFTFKDKARRKPVVSLKMACQDVVTYFASITVPNKLQEFTDKRNTKWAKMYCWEVVGKKALQLMADVYPHMGKRRQARIQEIFLEYQGKVGIDYSHLKHMEEHE
jgi:hypothetical protein